MQVIKTKSYESDKYNYSVSYNKHTDFDVNERSISIFDYDTFTESVIYFTLETLQSFIDCIFDTLIKTIDDQDFWKASGQLEVIAKYNNLHFSIGHN